MDKYQDFLANRLVVEVIETNQSSPKDNAISSKVFRVKDCSYSDGELKITQNENYNIVKYKVLIRHPILDKVWAVQENVRVEGTPIDEKTQIITIDFNKRVPSIFVSFKNNLSDPIEISIHYVEADKAAWDEKMKKKLAAELAKKVNVHFLEGDSFVDVVFAPVADNYDHAKITLFYKCNERGSSFTQLMGEYKTEKDRFFIPILNLGHGTYVIYLRQYDEHNNMIYESDALDFSL